MPVDLVLRSLREAVATMLAALATMACAWAIDPQPGAAILALVLGVSLSRSQLDRDLHGRIEAAFTLPAVSLAALGVGVLLQRSPWLGAVLFVAGMSLPIWLRRFGPAWRRAGALIALPFVVILTTPHLPMSHEHVATALLLPVVIALLALWWVAVAHALGRRLRWLPPPRIAPARPAMPAREASLRPPASTRMAVQMAVALATAFVVGYAFFAERWAWIVLTAYIVGSGNQGRLDVAYKSVLRVLGAAGGTVLALVFAFQLGSHDATTVVLILVAVFLGLWLRPLGYAWWAFFVTLALALLQGFEGTSARQVLWPRLEEIVLGAVIGVAAAWFVWPVRSTGVLRRRIADALAALGAAMDPTSSARSSGPFEIALADVEKVAPAFRAARHVTRGTQPADWADALAACAAPAIVLIGEGETPVAVRRAIGAARKAMREPQAILAALVDLRDALLASTSEVRASSPSRRAAT